MTNEELQAHIKAIRQAYWDDQLEERCANAENWGWPQASRVLSDNYEYRIKPTPREVWMICDSAGNVERITASEPCPQSGKIVKFREVLDES